MRQMTRVVTFSAAVVVAAPLAAAVTTGAGSASATGPEVGDGTFLAFSQILRRCDYSETDFNGPTGFGRPTGVIRSGGGNVTAEVQIATAVPNMRYDVRLIQMPRSSAATCVGGDPGVAAAALHTDAAGAGAVTVQDTIEPGATGAWVFISRPAAFSQNPAEFYTTDLVADI